MKFFQQLFRRYQQNESSQQERGLVDQLYDSADKVSRPEWMTDDEILHAKEVTWQKMSVRLGLASPHIIPAKHNRKISIRVISKYAAAALIIGAGVWGMMRWMDTTSSKQAIPVAYTDFKTAPGMRKHLFLPDGTEVWLNNGSSLKVRNISSADTAREVWLSEGEAYFQVTRDPQKPFIVHVDSLQTRVLGTAFSIRAYRALSTLQIAVTEGRVQVGKNRTVWDTLTRNMQLDYVPSKDEFTISSNELSAQSSWWNDRFVLNAAGFAELALRLKLKYGVLLISNNKRIQQTAFSANFPADASLENVLQTLCALYNTQYTVNGKTVSIH